MAILDAAGTYPGAGAGPSPSTAALHPHHEPAQFDLRSDIVTVPTPARLQAVLTTSLKDDVYREDSMAETFQAEMAAMTGHEDAIFMLSGTMSNQLGLRALLMQPPLTGASIQPVEAANRRHLTLEDIEAKIVLDEWVQYAPTRVIALENTLNGVVMPLDEVRRIAAFARAHGVKMHLDGARLWDVVAAGAGSLRDYCREFDTVNLCFSKGIGAPLGSVLVGDRRTIAQVRKVRQSVGGGMHQAGVITCMARVAVHDNFQNGSRESPLAQSHHKARHIAAAWERAGGKLIFPTETCVVYLDIKAAGITKTELVDLAQKHGLVLNTQRLVVHYQVSDEAVQRLERLFDDILAHKHRNGSL